MRKLILLASLICGFMICRAETWTPFCQAIWQDGILAAHKEIFRNASWNVTVEKSDERPNVYRMQPYVNHPVNSSNAQTDDVYVFVHAEEPDKVYLEPFVYHFFVNAYNNQYYRISQKVPENGSDSQYYGNIIDNAMEFPIGSFYYDAPCWAGDPSWISDDIHRIIFPEGILNSVKDSFVSIGIGEWKDFFSSANMEIKFDRSLTREGIYRANPYPSRGTEVIIHAANPERVWIEKFTVDGYVFEQKCGENGIGDTKYGNLKDGIIRIPRECFNLTDEYGLSVSSEMWSGEEIMIMLPEGYNKPLDEENGVFMGIISFNDQIDNMPMSILNSQTAESFTDFVNNMEMGNATLLYYGVDQAITSLCAPKYPDNLSKAVLITFTDGLDQGSLAMKPELLNSRNYAEYLSTKISETTVKGLPIQAYSIGLKGEDVVDEELFRLNLESLASSTENVHPVDDIKSVEDELYKIYEDLYRQTRQRVLSITVPMMSHEDKYRFTLDGISSPDKVETSELWLEGEFDISDFSFKNIVYHGFTTTSGDMITVDRNGVYVTLTFYDCRDDDGNILDIEKNDIDQWLYVPSKGLWQHNLENDKEGNIKIEDIRTSAAVTLVLDCSNSLGSQFQQLKQTANSFIYHLAGGNGELWIPTICIGDRDSDWSNAEYYNLQGVRVMNPSTGAYIQKSGTKTRKIIVR